MRGAALLASALLACGGGAPEVAGAPSAPARAVGPSVSGSAAAPRAPSRPPVQMVERVRSVAPARPAAPETTTIARPFQIDELPVGQLPESLAKKTAPRRFPVLSADEAGLEVKRLPLDFRTARPPFAEHAVRPTGFSVAHVRVHSWTGTVAAGEVGVSVFCGAEKSQHGVRTYFGYDRGVLATRWEGLKRVGDSFEYAIVDGWFDAESCRVDVRSRVSFPVKEIVPELVYVFRTCAVAAPDGKCTEGARAHFVFAGDDVASSAEDPGALQTALFTRWSVPVKRATAELVAATLPSSRQLAFLNATRGERKQPAPPTLELSIEVQQAAREEHPTAVVFATARR